MMRFVSRPWAVVAAVTVVTVALAGGVVLAISPSGCKVLGRCNAPLVASKVSPSPSSKPTLQASPTIAPYSPPATPSFEPAPAPTRNPSWPAYEYPASAGIPPLYPNASSGSWSFAGGLSCRLPIYVGGPGSGGFVVFSDGSFVADPRSNVTLPAGAPSPAQGGFGYGYGPGGPGFVGLSYDHAADKWLPVGFKSVSPDGRWYAYAGQSGIYVVKVADSTITELGEGKTWTLLDVETTGVYAAPLNAGGLWWLPLSGSAQQVSSQGFWQAIGGGAAYGTATSAVPQGVSNTILRLDLKTGTSQPWFMVDGGTSTAIGFDSKGVPIIASSSFPIDYRGPTQEAWLVPSVGGATVIVDNPAAQFFNPPIIADSRGYWTSNGQAIFVFIPGDGLHRAAGYGGSLAGACT